jgi:hypothetical protein
VGSHSVNIGSSAENTAAIDTGTTLIGAPTEAVNAIWGAVSGAVALTGNFTGFYSFRMLPFRPPPWRRAWRWHALRGVKKFYIAELTVFFDFPITSMRSSAEHCDIIWGTRVADQ